MAVIRRGAKNLYIIWFARGSWDPFRQGGALLGIQFRIIMCVPICSKERRSAAAGPSSSMGGVRSINMWLLDAGDITYILSEIPI